VIVLLCKLPVGKRLITQVDQNRSSQNPQEVGEMCISIQQKQQNRGTIISCQKAEVFVVSCEMIVSG